MEQLISNDKVRMFGQKIYSVNSSKLKTGFAQFDGKQDEHSVKDSNNHKLRRL